MSAVQPEKVPARRPMKRREGREPEAEGRKDSRSPSSKQVLIGNKFASLKEHLDVNVNPFPLKQFSLAPG